MSAYSAEQFQSETPQLYPRLRRAVTAYLAGSDVDPDDILQETFLKAIRNLDGFRGQAGIYSWLYSIARNLCIDEFRKQQNRSMITSVPVEEFELASDQFADEAEREEILILRKAIAVLPVMFRDVVIMKAIEQMSYEEIADITGVNIQTLKNRMFRARKMLAESLKKMGVDEP